MLLAASADAVPAQNINVAVAARVPASWNQKDPADSLYRLARAALNQNNYKRAAEVFARIPERYPTSTYAGDALYWQAFSLYRVGGEDNLDSAQEALDEQADKYPRAATRGDARVLRERIRGELARLGNAKQGEDVAKEAGKAVKPATAGCKGNDDDEDDVRATALNALLQMDASAAVPILKQVLARRDPCSESLRKKAVFLVAQKRTTDTEDILMNVIRTDPSPEVRSQGVFWMSQVPGDKAIGLLEEILKTSKDEEVLDKAVFAVSQHNSARAGQILRDYAMNEAAPVEIRDKAIFWLGQQNNADNGAFLRTLFARLTNEDLKEKVLFSISQRRKGEGNDKWLMDVAIDPKQSIEVRKKALFWAGQAGTPIEGLAELYNKVDNQEIREQLIFVYSQRRETAAVDKLLDIAKNEKNIELRKKAIFWLSQSKDPRVAKFLLDIINQ
jgi:HEAT repeat protein